MGLPFRRLLTVSLVSGAGAGLLLAALQDFTVMPLIRQAEAYERDASAHEDPANASVVQHPGEGLERTTYTVLGTTLMGIAFSALLFGVAALFLADMSLRRGLLLGLAGFACFVLAPAFGLPPMPPGVIDADLHAAQTWWIGTAVATAVGLWAIGHRNGRLVWRVAGLSLVVLPHLLGAPSTDHHGGVPVSLIRQFVLASIATRAVFWLMLGAWGGWLFSESAGSSQPR